MLPISTSRSLNLSFDSLSYSVKTGIIKRGISILIIFQINNSELIKIFTTLLTVTQLSNNLHIILHYLITLEVEAQ